MLETASTALTRPVMEFGPASSFDEEEKATLADIAEALSFARGPASGRMLDQLQTTVDRVGLLADVVQAHPPIFSERVLGEQTRDQDSLVDALAQVDDTMVDLHLPMRAVVGRTLVLAELNTWRLAEHIVEQEPDAAEIAGGKVQHWMNGCVYTLVAEEILLSILRDENRERPIRALALDHLARMWETRHLFGARHFFPLLAATWAARQRIRVSVGTLLGVSEIMRLLQAGCDPEFVEYFSRTSLTNDEREAFQEFLIGVSTERIHSLSLWMDETGQSSMSPEEANLGEENAGKGQESLAFYRFFRERSLQAVARRIRDEPGPKRTAEEYVMVYFLDSSA